MADISGLTFGLESPLQSFARRHNHGSAYRALTGTSSGASPYAATAAASKKEGSASPNIFDHNSNANVNDRYTEEAEEETAATNSLQLRSAQSRFDTRRQLDEELNYVDKQKELERLQAAIDNEQHVLANRRVSLRDREASLLEAQRALEAQQAALRLEIAAFEAEQLRAAEEQRRLDQAAESLHNKQRQLDEDIKHRHDSKALANREAAAHVQSAQDQNPFNALNDALRLAAPLGVMRAIIENHIGGVNVVNHKYNQWTPLHYAAWHGNDHLCELLVANEAVINPQDSYSHYTPLDWALSRQHDAAARYLASVGGKRGVAIIKEVSSNANLNVSTTTLLNSTGPLPPFPQIIGGGVGSVSLSRVYQQQQF